MISVVSPGVIAHATRSEKPEGDGGNRGAGVGGGFGDALKDDSARQNGLTDVPAAMRKPTDGRPVIGGTPVQSPMRVEFSKRSRQGREIGRTHDMRNPELGLGNMHREIAASGSSAAMVITSLLSPFMKDMGQADDHVNASHPSEGGGEPDCMIDEADSGILSSRYGDGASVNGVVGGGAKVAIASVQLRSHFDIRSAFSGNVVAGIKGLCPTLNDVSTPVLDGSHLSKAAAPDGVDAARPEADGASKGDFAHDARFSSLQCKTSDEPAMPMSMVGDAMNAAGRLLGLAGAEPSGPTLIGGSAPSSGAVDVRAAETEREPEAKAAVGPSGGIGRELDCRLSSDELGHMNISLRFAAGALEVAIAVSTRDALRVVEQKRAEMLAEFRHNGVELATLEVGYEALAGGPDNGNLLGGAGPDKRRESRSREAGASELSPGDMCNGRAERAVEVGAVGGGGFFF